MHEATVIMTTLCRSGSPGARVAEHKGEVVLVRLTLIDPACFGKELLACAHLLRLPRKTTGTGRDF